MATDSLKEDKILQQLIAGDIPTFDFIFHSYYNAVLRNIRRFVRDDQSAEDILQDVFVRLWERKEALAPSTSLGGWLMVVSHNMALNFLQKKVGERLVALSEEDESFQALSENSVDNKRKLESHLQHLEKAIQSLPAKQLQAFTLCRLQSKTYTQASDILGISPHTVREYVNKAMDKIRHEFVGVPSDTVFVLILLLSIR